MDGAVPKARHQTSFCNYKERKHLTHTRDLIGTSHHVLVIVRVPKLVHVVQVMNRKPPDKNVFLWFSCMNNLQKLPLVKNPILEQNVKPKHHKITKLCFNENKISPSCNRVPSSIVIPKWSFSWAPLFFLAFLVLAILHFLPFQPALMFVRHSILRTTPPRLAYLMNSSSTFLADQQWRQLNRKTWPLLS